MSLLPRGAKQTVRSRRCLLFNPDFSIISELRESMAMCMFRVTLRAYLGVSSGVKSALYCEIGGKCGDFFSLGLTEAWVAARPVCIWSVYCLAVAVWCMFILHCFCVWLIFYCVAVVVWTGSLWWQVWRGGRGRFKFGFNPFDFFSPLSATCRISFP